MTEAPPNITVQRLMSLSSPVLDEPAKEFLEPLIEGTNCRLERIVSQGHCSPDGFWYDQPQWEWVAVLQGAARLEFEGTPRQVIEMQVGDAVTIPAHRKHRVAWTASVPPTVWLAVHYDPQPETGSQEL